MKFWMNSKLINITIKKWWIQFAHKKIKKVALDNDNKKKLKHLISENTFGYGTPWTMILDIFSKFM